MYLSCLACTAALGLPPGEEQQRLLQQQLEEAGLSSTSYASALPLVAVQVGGCGWEQRPVGGACGGW